MRWRAGLGLGVMFLTYHTTRLRPLDKNNTISKVSACILHLIRLAKRNQRPSSAVNSSKITIKTRTLELGVCGGRSGRSEIHVCWLIGLY